ncbi:hypothetical protein F5B20DRAFT_575963 [Whalleya microplaca]|nr:hypothetical protein F5B20DRAFT_575963 [Whalleya microplaca]
MQCDGTVRSGIVCTAARLHGCNRSARQAEKGIIITVAAECGATVTIYLYVHIYPPKLKNLKGCPAEVGRPSHSSGGTAAHDVRDLKDADADADASATTFAFQLLANTPT